MLFQGNSNCKELLCLSLKCDKGSSLGERQYYVLFKTYLSFAGISFILTDQEIGPARKNSPLA